VACRAAWWCISHECMAIPDWVCGCTRHGNATRDEARRHEGQGARGTGSTSSPLSYLAALVLRGRPWAGAEGGGRGSPQGRQVVRHHAVVASLVTSDGFDDGHDGRCKPGRRGAAMARSSRFGRVVWRLQRRPRSGSHRRSRYAPVAPRRAELGLFSRPVRIGGMLCG
jgi:hypothetical protein